MKKRDSFLNLAIPDISEQEVFEVIDSLKSGWISVGPKVNQFENLVAEYHEVKHAIAVSSCTTALFLIAKNLGICEGDYVIVPTISWQSTANIVEQLGAKPVFADVDKDTLNISIGHVDELLKKHGKKIRAIIPVHLSGLPVNIAFFSNINSKYRIPIIYDAAHAIFSSYMGKMVGTYGQASAFSFYATKNITTGDGGMITTNDDKLADECRLWSYHGLPKDSWKRYSAEAGSPHVQCIVPGYKFNLTDLQAALGLAQMKRRGEFILKRNQLIEHYNHILANIDFIRTPVFQNETGKWANHVYVVQLKDDRINRDLFMAELRKLNIGTNIHFYPIHKNYYYLKKYPGIVLPNADWLSDRIMTLPLCTKYSTEDIDYVAEAIRYIYEQGLAQES